MNFGPGIPSWLRRAVVFLILLSGVPAHAELLAELLKSAPHQVACETVLSGIQSEALPDLKARNTRHIQRLLSETKLPGFDMLEEDGKYEYQGKPFPKALQALAGVGKMVMFPAPTAPLDVAVGKDYQTKSIVLHLDHEWAGGPSNTAVYLHLPHTQTPHEKGYLVGPETHTLVVSLHGGGTRTGTGDNGMSIAKETNLPVMAFDLMGHGMATRNFRGIEDIDKQLDWIADIIDKTVDPRVELAPIIGHSWGAQFVLRLWTRANEPKFKRFKSFIAASGPVDASFGTGKDDGKFQIERDFEAHLEKFRARIAEADYDFLSGMVRGGKPADTGNSHANQSDISFRVPILTPEQQALLPPLTLIVGDHDGLVYVGREEAYNKFGNSLIAPHRFILLGPGKNWRSKETGKTYETGHSNIWDRYIDGTEIPLLYDLIAKEYGAINRKSQGDYWGCIAWMCKDGDPIVALAQSADGEVRARAKATIALWEIYWRYAKWFVDREYVDPHIEYVSERTADFDAINDSKDALQRYVNIYNNREGRYHREEQTRVKTAGDGLRKELGINEAITVEKAKFELALPAPSPERQADLEAYMETYKALETKIREEVGATGAHRVGDDPRLAAVPRPEGVSDYGAAKREFEADRSEARRTALEQYIVRYPEVIVTVRSLIALELAEEAKKDKIPPSVGSIEEARSLLAQQSEVLDFTYVPSDHPEIQPLADTIRYLAGKKQDIITGLKPVKNVREGMPSRNDHMRRTKNAGDERRRAVDRFEKLWKEGLISSPLASQVFEGSEAKVKIYERSYRPYKNEALDRDRGLAATGQNTAENLQNMTPELKEIRAGTWADKAAMVEALDRLSELRWDEALAGHLTAGPKGDAVAEAVELATKVWGTSRAEPSPESLTADLNKKQAEYDRVLHNLSLLDQSLNRLRWEYTQTMQTVNAERTAAGKPPIPLPFKITRAAIGEELDQQTYYELVDKLSRDPSLLAAFEKTISDSNSFLNQLRNEQQNADQ